MTALRQTVRELMLSIHRVRFDLVDVWLSDMDDEEVERRFRMYQRLGLTGVELSAAGPNERGVNVLLPGCHAPNDDGRPRSTQPCSCEYAGIGSPFVPGPAMPESGEVNRGKPGDQH